MTKRVTSLNDLAQVVADLGNRMSDMEVRLGGKMSNMESRLSETESQLKGSMFAMETRLSGEISGVSRGLGKTNKRLGRLEGLVEAIHNDVKEIYSLI
jgi:hypothetical protein